MRCVLNHIFPLGIPLVLLAEDPHRGRLEIIELAGANGPNEGGEEDQRQEESGGEGDVDGGHGAILLARPFIGRGTGFRSQVSQASGLRSQA